MKLTVTATLAAAALALTAASPISATPPRPGCSPVQTRALISHFVAAFNTGNRRAINDTWASKLWFKWYSVTTDPGARTPEAAARRDTLLSYLADRHAANERLTLTNVKISGVSSGGYRNFEFHLMRSAADLVGGPTAYRGKGASTCSTGRLIAWVMSAAE